MSVDCTVTEYLILTDDYKHTSKISKYKISYHLLLFAASRKRGSSLFLTCNGFFHSTQSFARSMYSRNLDLCLFVCKDVVCLGGRYFC